MNKLFNAETQSRKGVHFFALEVENYLGEYCAWGC